MRFINLCCFPRGAQRWVSRFTDQHLVLPCQSVVGQGESAQPCLLSSGNQLPELSPPWDREEKESFPRNTSLLLHSSQSKQRSFLCFISAGLETEIITAGSRPLQPSAERFRRQEGRFGVLEPGGGGGLWNAQLWAGSRWGVRNCLGQWRHSAHADFRESLWGVGQHQASID